MPYPVKVFATRGSEGLTEEICQALQPRLSEDLKPDGCLTLGKVDIVEFSNDNILLQVENVRERMVVVVHTQVPPVDKRIIELFHLLDAINNARPADVMIVFPYMPYSRSDRKNQPRISTFGHTLPHILTTSFGVKRVILLDPHDSHLKHYFMPAADEISAIYLLIDYLKREVLNPQARANSVIVFSDAGAAKRYGQITHILNLSEAYISKERPNNQEEPQLKKVVGKVRGKFCILVDDEILTGHTAIGDAELLLKAGAKSICMLAIHSILAHNNFSQQEVIKKLEDSPIDKFFITDSIPVNAFLDKEKFIVISVANLIAEAIKRAVIGESLTALHQLENVYLYK